MVNAALILSYVRMANDRLGDPLSPLTQVQLVKRETAVEMILPQDTWRMAWNDGQHWTQEKALAAAEQALEMGL